LLKAGRLDEARAALLLPIALNADSAGAHSIVASLAVNYARNGHASEALMLIGELLAHTNGTGEIASSDSETVGICVQQFRRLGQLSACRAATAALEAKYPKDMHIFYNAACCRALTAAAQVEEGGPGADRLAKDEADLAMVWLRKAIDTGIADYSLLFWDDDLDILRDREEFRELLVYAETKAPPLVRARCYILLSQWDKAAAEFAQVDWSRPLDDNASAFACLFLIRGDREGYNNFCNKMIEAHAQDGAYDLVRSCEISPQGPVGPAQVLLWANQVFAASHYPWDYHVLGLAQYRAGQFDQALQSLNQVNVNAWRYAGLNWFALALVHHRLGHPVEARQCLDKGIQWLARVSPSGPGQPAKLLPQDWLEALLLRREAEELLTQQPNP
jgi:tetratricopeptide (TPR) repeat protein